MDDEHESFGLEHSNGTARLVCHSDAQLDVLAKSTTTSLEGRLWLAGSILRTPATCLQEAQNEREQVLFRLMAQHHTCCVSPAARTCLAFCYAKTCTPFHSTKWTPRAPSSKPSRNVPQKEYT